MTSKLSWIAFAPFSIAAIAIKVIQVLFVDQNGMFLGLNQLMLSYLSIACAVVVMLFAAIFCLIDRKTAPVYIINRNVVCGIIGLLLAVALASEGANRAFVLFRSMGADFFEIADIVLTILCAIVFVVLGLNHFVGNGGVKGLAVFYLVPALWSAFRLIECFMGFTTVSIAVTDVTILACYILATLFLFNYAMIIALMKGRSPVKSAFIYGLPAVIVLLAYGTFELLNSAVVFNSSFNLFANLESIELLLLGIYILAFVIEMSVNVKRKENVNIIEDKEEEYEEIKDEADMGAIAGSVTNSNIADYKNTNKKINEQLAVGDEVFFEVAQASMESENNNYEDVDANEFIYGTAPTDDDFVMPVDNDGEEYVPQQSDESADMYITKADSTYDVEEDISEEDSDSQMDRIDKLILEITEDDVI